ncbi:hypothetical protein HMPREF3291_06365 [Bacillus sp. HMSC76G11]|nr:hypothetical protein HMPREF3291_06365 [Bacillus sp. HMSC76G11]
MINENHSNEKLPNELSAVFSELQLSKHLRKAGIRKSFVFSCAYLFHLVFCLTFHQKNWFALVTSKKSDSFPGKDTGGSAAAPVGSPQCATSRRSLRLTLQSTASEK